MPEIRITIIDIIKINEIQYQLIYKANSEFKDFRCDNIDVIRHLGINLEISPQNALKRFNKMIKETSRKHDLYTSYLKYFHLI